MKLPIFFIHTKISTLTQQTHYVSTTLYNVVRRLFSQCCEKDVTAVLPHHKMTALQCNMPTMLQDVVGMLYMKFCFHNVATILCYSPILQPPGGITVCRGKTFFILLHFRLCFCNIIYLFILKLFLLCILSQVKLLGFKIL